jgi:hypothetical protein
MQGKCPGNFSGTSRERRMGRPGTGVWLRCDSVWLPGCGAIYRLASSGGLSDHSHWGGGRGARAVQEFSFRVGYPARTCCVVKSAVCVCPRRHCCSDGDRGSPSIRLPGEVTRNRCFGLVRTKPMSQAVRLQTVRWALEIIRSADPSI